MRQPACVLLLCASLLLPVLAGCVSRDADPPAPPPPTVNACTPYPAPSLDLSSTTTFRGSNAYAYMLGLVCDHTGPMPLERARVPGTANHTAGAGYLYGAFKAAGAEVRFQNFTGSHYEGIMTDPAYASSSYKYYYSSCDAAGLQRVRGLQFSNLEARLGNPTGPLVLLMAHWDSKRFADDGFHPVLGANDGAAGVGVLVELARVAAALSLPWDLRLLATDGEDGFEDCHPLAGSTYYAEQFSKSTDRARLRAIVLLDMIGDLDAIFYKGCGKDAALADRIWAIAARYDVRQFRNQGGCFVLDDHTPFEERGMNAVDIIDKDPAFPPYWHTTGDTPDKVDPDMLAAMGRVLTTLLDELPVAGA